MIPSLWVSHSIAGSPYQVLRSAVMWSGGLCKSCTSDLQACSAADLQVCHCVRGRVWVTCRAGPEAEAGCQPRWPAATRRPGGGQKAGSCGDCGGQCELSLSLSVSQISDHHHHGNTRPAMWDSAPRASMFTAAQEFKHSKRFKNLSLQSSAHPQICERKEML